MEKKKKKDEEEEVVVVVVGKGQGGHVGEEGEVVGRTEAREEGEVVVMSQKDRERLKEEEGLPVASEEA